ncbi:MAG: hypothetical protein ACOCPW_02930 [Marinilabiliaceae bacterium]
MYKPTIFTSENPPSDKEKAEMTDFLLTHLDQFGDPREDITKAIDYALKISNSFGGFVIKLTDNAKITGVVIINKTGMDGYIP